MAKAKTTSTFESNVAKARKAAMARIASNKENSPKAIERALKKESAAMLDTIIEQLDALTPDENIIPEYNYTNLVNKILTIVRTLQYAKKEFRDAAFETAGLDDTIVEDTKVAMGSYSYYSPKLHIVVTGEPVKVEELQDCILEIAESLGLPIMPVDGLTQAIVNTKEAYAMAKAQGLYNGTEAALKLAETAPVNRVA